VVAMGHQSALGSKSRFVTTHSHPPRLSCMWIFDRNPEGIPRPLESLQIQISAKCVADLLIRWCLCDSTPLAEMTVP